MKSYGQFCGVARGLDLVGDRWSLLIVRELLVRDCRFKTLQAELPGIATNMLASRLRTLQDAGLVEHVELPAPAASGAYRLTARGRELQPVLREIARWSIPLMAAGQGDDIARGHWVLFAADALFHDADLSELVGRTIAVECGDQGLTLEVRPPGQLVSRPGREPEPDVRVAGGAEAVMSALTGMPARERADVQGDASVLEVLRAHSSAEALTADVPSL